MLEVGDQPDGHGFLIQGLPRHAWLPVVEATLRVEDVRHHAGARDDGVVHLGAGRVGVADRDHDAGSNKSANRLERARKLRGECEHRDLSGCEGIRQQGIEIGWIRFDHEPLRRARPDADVTGTGLRHARRTRARHRLLGVVALTAANRRSPATSAGMGFVMYVG